MASLRREQEMRLVDVSSAGRQRTASAAGTMKRWVQNCGQNTATNSGGGGILRNAESWQDRAERFSSFMILPGKPAKESYAGGPLVRQSNPALSRQKEKERRQTRPHISFGKVAVEYRTA